ncbi:sulfotransferase family protein [Pseudomonadales bacterium]|jgi:hypothetical protein|nr:sulfotransferase family protein [Pseudomonadales bacterium]
MLSLPHKCIFVHIPKTAGQSIERFFLRRLGLGWGDRRKLLLRPNSDPRRGPDRLAHLTMREYLQYGYVDSEQFNHLYKFAFVRNPWDKIVSSFNYRQLYKHMSFREYIFEKQPKPIAYQGAYRHVMRQVDYICDEFGEICVDYVGRFETLQRDFDHVCSSLDIPANQLPHTNISTNQHGDTMGNKKRHYSEYYDGETKEKVAEMYKEDIDTFNYRFEAIS